MVDLITATQCLSKLEAVGIKYSKGYFSQMTTEGKIPHHSKHGSPKKFYRFDEVLDSIRSTQDPTRDAQREANEKKRAQESSDLFEAAGTYKSIADMSDEERKQYEENLRKELAEARAAAEEAKAAGATADIPGMDVSSVDGVTLADAKVLKEYWLGRKAELDFKKMSGEVIENREVERQAFETARAVRDAILAIPIRISSILAAQNDPHAIKNILTNELTSALGNLNHVS